MSDSQDPPKVPDVNLPTLGTTGPPDGQGGSWPATIVGKPTGDDSGGSQVKPGTPPPNTTPYNVDLAQLRSAEGNVNTATNASMATYNDLKSYIAQVAPWIFAASSAEASTAPVAPVGGGGYDGMSWGSTFASGGTDNHSTSDPNAIALHNTQDQVMLQVADAIQYSGTYVSALNQAAQLYSKSDMDSYVPNS